MSTSATFVGSIPEDYDTFLGPFLFEPYAADLAARMSLAPGSSILETSCATIPGHCVAHSSSKASSWTTSTVTSAWR